MKYSSCICIAKLAKLKNKHQQTNWNCSSISIFSLTSIQGLQLFFLYMATIAQMTKLRVIRKSVALELYHLEVGKFINNSLEVGKFTNNTYQFLSDNTLITSSSDKNKMVCIKRKSTNCSTRKPFLGKAMKGRLLKYDLKKKWSTNIMCGHQH